MGNYAEQQIQDGLKTEQLNNSQKDRITKLIKQHYRYDRLEGRDGDTWGKNYSENIISSRLADVETLGTTLISRHESATGERIIIDMHGGVS